MDPKFTEEAGYEPAAWETPAGATSAGPLGYSEFEGAGPETDPLESRYLELSHQREERLAAETERLQRELRLVTDRLRAERETELTHVRAESDKARQQLERDLAQERDEKTRLAAELARVRGALEEELKRVKGVNAYLEGEVRRAQAGLAAAGQAAAGERERIAELNRTLELKLRSVQERLEGLDKRYRSQIDFLEAGAEKLRREVELREEMAGQARAAVAAAAHRAEEAERANRSWEEVWKQQEQIVYDKLEPKLRAEFESRLRAEQALIRPTIERDAEERISKAAEALRAEHDAALDRERRRLIAERDLALAEEKAAAARAAAEAEQRGREEGQRAGAAQMAERLHAAEEEAQARLRRLSLFYDKRYAEREKPLVDARREADAQLAELKAQREKAAQDLAQAKASLEREFTERFRAAQAVAAQRLDRVSADAEHRLKVQAEEMRTALTTLKAQLSEEKERELAAALKRARAEDEAHLREVLTRRIQGLQHTRAEEQGREAAAAQARLKEALDAAARQKDAELARLEERLDAAAREKDAVAGKVRAEFEAAAKEQEAALARAKERLEDALRDKEAEAARLRAELEAAGRDKLTEAAQRRELLEAEKARIRAQVDAEKSREIEGLRRTAVAAALHRQEEYLQRLTQAREEWQRQHEGEAAEARARWAAERDKEAAELRAAHASDIAAMRRALEEERRGLEAEVTRRVRKEAELELAQQTEKLTADWHVLRGRFEEQLSSARDEFKKREREWQDGRQASALEFMRLKEQARAELSKLENEGVRLAQEKAALQERTVELESRLRKAREDFEADLRRAEARREEAEKREAALRAELDAAAKDAEARVKAVQAELSAEKRKVAEILSKNDALERRSVWNLLGGNKP